MQEDNRITRHPLKDGSILHSFNGKPIYEGDFYYFVFPHHNYSIGNNEAYLSNNYEYGPNPIEYYTVVFLTELECLEWVEENKPLLNTHDQIALLKWVWKYRNEHLLPHPHLLYKKYKEWIKTDC